MTNVRVFFEAGLVEEPAGSKEVDHFLIELRTPANHEIVEEVEVDKNTREHIFEDVEPGDYYAAVVGIDAAGEMIGEWMTTSTVTVVPETVNVLRLSSVGIEVMPQV